MGDFADLASWHRRNSQEIILKLTCPPQAPGLNICSPAPQMWCFLPLGNISATDVPGQEERVLLPLHRARTVISLWTHFPDNHSLAVVPPMEKKNPLSPQIANACLREDGQPGRPMTYSSQSSKLETIPGKFKMNFPQ